MHTPNNSADQTDNESLALELKVPLGILGVCSVAILIAAAVVLMSVLG